MRQAKRPEYLMHLDDFRQMIINNFDEDSDYYELSESEANHVSHCIVFALSIIEMLEKYCVDPDLDYYDFKPGLKNSVHYIEWLEKELLYYSKMQCPKATIENIRDVYNQKVKELK